MDFLRQKKAYSIKSSIKSAAHTKPGQKSAAHTKPGQKSAGFTINQTDVCRLFRSKVCAFIRISFMK